MRLRDYDDRSTRDDDDGDNKKNKLPIFTYTKKKCPLNIWRWLIACPQKIKYIIFIGIAESASFTTINNN